jgi:predicted nucleic acid-binding protein
MPFVLDNSVVCGWIFENQANAYTESVAQRLLDDRAHAPGLWPMELANILRTGCKRGSLIAQQAQAVLENLAALPIDTDTRPASAATLLSLALRHDLSACDAAYLELAPSPRPPVPPASACWPERAPAPHAHARCCKPAHGCRASSAKRSLDAAQRNPGFRSRRVPTWCRAPRPTRLTTPTALPGARLRRAINAASSAGRSSRSQAALLQIHAPRPVGPHLRRATIAPQPRPLPSDAGLSPTPATPHNPRVTTTRAGNG